MLEHKISWKVLKIFTQECLNDDFGLTLTFYGKGKCFLSYIIWEEFMADIEDIGAKLINTCTVK